MELFQEGHEIGYDEMRKLQVGVFDSCGKRIRKVRSAKAVKGGLVVKILAMTHEDQAVVRSCTKCSHSAGEVVEFSGHVNGGFFAKITDE